MTTALTFATTCPACGAPLRVINPGATNGRETKLVAACTTRQHGQWLITARITQLTPTGERQWPNRR